MIEEKLKNIDLLLMDVDGVLTNGKIFYDNNGYEIKRFSVRDGLGIRLLLKFKICLGIITGRNSPAVIHRCNELGIKHYKIGVNNKVEALNDLLRETGILAINTAFIGDDLPDLSVMKCVGLPIAVADADELVLKSAKIVTYAKGGEGAIRELSELILKSKGKWGQALEQFIK